MEPTRESPPGATSPGELEETMHPGMLWWWKHARGRHGCGEREGAYAGDGGRSAHGGRVRRCARAGEVRRGPRPGGRRLAGEERRTPAQRGGHRAGQDPRGARLGSARAARVSDPDGRVVDLKNKATSTA